MISFLKKTFFAFSAVAIMLPSFALAAVLDVDFEATPLFLNANVVPGDAEARTVKVTNLGTESQAVYVSVQNTFSDGLADVMQLNVSDGANNYFNGSFSNFFTTTPIALGTLAGGSSRTYTFSASLASGIGNDYQTKKFGFDLIIGFEGGESTTDGGGGGSGGGGGGGSKYLFTIFNELVADVDNDAHSATLTWNTNHNGSTYLVCGNQVDGPFTLDPNAPLFGYKFDVPEVAVNSISHQVTLTNLAFGTYECRPVSRPTPSSPFTVGKDLHFSIVPPGEVLGDSTTPTPTPFAGYTGNLNKPNEPTGSVLGVSTSSPEESAPGDVLGVNAEKTESVPDEGMCELWWLILLAVISFSWSLIEDLIRKTRTYFKSLFLRNAIFTAVYVFALYFSQINDLLNHYWYIPAGAWLLMTIFDYRAHRYEFPDWSAVSRNLYYALLSMLFIATYYFFGFPCVWWPFALIALGSLLLLVLQSLKKSNN